MNKNKINDNSKQKIIAVATKLFAQNGFDGVSTRTICKQANINISMISYYFGGKQELYQAIIDNLTKNLTEYVKTFVDFDMDLKKLSKKEKLDFLYNYGNICLIKLSGSSSDTSSLKPEAPLEVHVSTTPSLPKMKFL